nr:WAS/WASL-interacting protein family member 3-like [Chlorocebus sabaeus]
MAESWWLTSGTPWRSRAPKTPDPDGNRLLTVLRASARLLTRPSLTSAPGCWEGDEARGFNLERGRRRVRAPTGREREARPASAAPPGHAPSRLSPPTAEGREGAATGASVRGGGAHSPAGRGGAAGVSASAVARAQAPAPSTAAAAPGPSPTTTPPPDPPPAPPQPPPPQSPPPPPPLQPRRGSANRREGARTRAPPPQPPPPTTSAPGRRRTRKGAGGRARARRRGRGWALEGVAPPLARLPTRSLGWVSCAAAGSAELLQVISSWQKALGTEPPSP